MLEWFFYALLGALAGLSSGILGLGGGVIIVPALLLSFSWQGLSEHYTMHMAVATSLMTIIVTSLTSSYAHHRRGNVNWHLVKKLAPGLIIGSSLGAIMATMLASKLLQQLFALYIIFVGVKIWLPNAIHQHSAFLKNSALISFGGVAGMISALVGIGGGTIIIPYLLMAKQSIRQAIATSVVCSLPISIAAVAGFFIMEKVHVEGMTTYIYWPAFLGIISTSSFFAILGVKIANNLPLLVLRQLFSVVLIVGAVYLLL